MSEPRILKEEIGPNGNIRAVVEDDGRSVHLYLEATTDDHPFGVRSCWVRNLRPAPALIEAERMRAGLAPMLPARCCLHPQGAAPLRPEDLEFLWFESGDGVALLERGDVLAVIPPWSGAGLSGYARDCALASPLCDPLGSPDRDHHGIFARLARAAAFWASWDHDPWPRIQEGLMQALERALGPHSKYYSTDPEVWPPRSLTRFDRQGFVVAVTGGMSLRPQPRATRPSRIELGIAWEPRGSDPTPVLSFLSGQALLPWARNTCLDEGHAIALFAPGQAEIGPAFRAVLLRERPPGAPPIDLPPFEGEPVRLLWMVPITDSELEFLRREGPDALRERLDARGVGWIHRDRAPVVG